MNRGIYIFAIIFFLLKSFFVFAENGDDLGFELSFGFQQDWTFYGAADDLLLENYGLFEDSVEFRRAVVSAKGKLGKRYEFKVHFDLATGKAKWKDMYLKIKNLPFNITIGHFREPFGLEKLSGCKAITFLEWSLVNAIVPGRNSGLMMDTGLFGDRLYIAFGVFREVDDLASARDQLSIYDYTFRVAGSPIYSNNGICLLHTGTAISKKSISPGGSIRYKTRPENHITENFVDTGYLESKSALLMDLEAAAVVGPFSIQGEYTASDVDSEKYGLLTFNSFYFQASLWLTGEHRNYKIYGAKFREVIPNSAFLVDGGLGGFELAVRYSVIDLNDRCIKGGFLEDLTFSVNWHLNQYIKVSSNYLISEHKEFGTFSLFTLRFQVYFNI